MNIFAASAVSFLRSEEVDCQEMITRVKVKENYHSRQALHAHSIYSRRYLLKRYLVIPGHEPTHQIDSFCFRPDSEI